MFSDFTPIPQPAPSLSKRVSKMKFNRNIMVGVFLL